ncbi:MAG: biotin/lipoyl-containing protein, partial [Pseudomonadota bacterium]
MGEAGRKLTIRMPDNPRLRSAEVGQIHLDPGATVRVGSPVMTLVSGKREHMVRAPRPGRVVPLVAAADEVEAGDPLYILNIDEAALAAAKKGDREVVAVEKAKWAAGVTPDVIEPVARHRADTAPRGRDVSEIVTEWAKPALAIALYVLACFALLPILNAFGREASTGTLIGMCVGSIVFGLIIFHLYAPDGGWWPRWTVRMVALSWVGISSIAIFYQQETPDDITLADAAAPLTRLFDADGTIAPAAPGPAPEPAVVLASGVAAGPSDARPVPNHTAPKSVLGEPGPAPTPHRVSVREWRRVNPTNTSGEVLAFDQRDVTGGGLGADPGDAAPTAVALAALTGGDALPEALAAMPDLSVFAAIAEAAADAAGTVTAMRITDVPTAPAADAGPGVAAIDDQGPGIREAVALTDNADPALRPGTDVAAIATWLGSSPLPVLKSEAPREPAEETEPAVAANSEAASAARATAQVAASGGAVARPSVDAEGSSEAWVQAQAIPVLRGQGAPAA